MKKYINTLAGSVTLACLLMSLAVSRADAAHITLTWDPPALNTDGSSLTNLVGYRVHYGTASGVYGASVDTGLTPEATVSNLQDGTRFFFSVKAVNSAGLESDASAEFVWDAPVPVVPTAIVTQPTDLTVAAPAPATFSVEATGETLAYQWLRNGEAIANATAANYTLAQTAVSTDNGATFAVIVSGAGGAVTSAVATLTVSDTTAPVIAGPTAYTYTANSKGNAYLPNLVTDMTITDNATARADLVVTQTPAAWATLYMGTTLVTITATDEAGNASQHTVTITVVAPSRPNPPKNLRIVTKI